MGLDGVELVMAVEEKFGIEIADAEAQYIRTPRLFFDLVEKKVRTVPSDTCLTQRAFYLLRRAFRRQFNIARSQFRPGTKLESLIPPNDRQQRWQELKGELGAITWPKLRYPRSVQAAIFASLLAAGWAAYIWAGPGDLQRTIIVTLATGATALIVIPLATPFRTSFAGQTVGSLTDFLVTSNNFLFGPMADAWTRERIRLEVRRIIVEQLGVAPDFSDDADFVRDLGVD